MQTGGGTDREETRLVVINAPLVLPGTTGLSKSILSSMLMTVTGQQYPDAKYNLMEMFSFCCITERFIFSVNSIEYLYQLNSVSIQNSSKKHQE